MSFSLSLLLVVVASRAAAAAASFFKVGEAIVGPAKAQGPKVELSDLVKVKTLGTGTFGRVKLVQNKHTKQARYRRKIGKRGGIRVCFSEIVFVR